ncbi:hypothetical protein GC177_02135 [bacterium]|nr:hypothetical protein [bacterium]
METQTPSGGHTPVFLKAVKHYGEHGRNKKLPKDVEAALEGDHPTTHYIWHTAGDTHVRPEHAANDGKIFAWSKPPKTGHPGEAAGCRCWAEDYYRSVKDIDDPPIEAVYPELILAPILKVGSQAIRLAIQLIKGTSRSPAPSQPGSLTNHGVIRISQRNISSQEIEDAIRSAKETGNFLAKTGKYGTKQIHYRGQNGVTVIMEMEGRNAGKVITLWRHKQ